MKLVTRSICAFILIQLIAVQLIYAQTLTQTLRGTIVDEDNKSPLIGASVSLTFNSLTKGTVTNEKGEFRFDNVPVGRAELQV